MRILPLIIGLALATTAVAADPLDSSQFDPVRADPVPDPRIVFAPGLATAGTAVTGASGKHAAVACTPLNPCATVTPARQDLRPVSADAALADWKKRTHQN